MRLTLSDGTTIDSSFLNATSRSSSRRRENAPSKRQVKNGGGSLKRHHSRQAGKTVGGTTDMAKAMYDSHNFVTDPETGEVVIDRQSPKAMCHVVDASKKTFTWELGGSTPSPYRGGKGI